MLAEAVTTRLTLLASRKGMVYAVSQDLDVLEKATITTIPLYIILSRALEVLEDEEPHVTLAARAWRVVYLEDLGVEGTTMPRVWVPPLLGIRIDRFIHRVRTPGMNNLPSRVFISFWFLG
jgi:hypothetical protein